MRSPTGLAELAWGQTWSGTRRQLGLGLSPCLVRKLCEACLSLNFRHRLCGRRWLAERLRVVAAACVIPVPW